MMKVIFMTTGLKMKIKGKKKTLKEQNITTVMLLSATLTKGPERKSSLTKLFR